MVITPGNLSDPKVLALLNTHVTSARTQTAIGSAHALDVRGLQTPDLSFWTIWTGESLSGIGALKRLSSDHGEIKSMHTAEAARRTGIGSAMLRHLIALARAQKMTRLSLETGSSPYFAPARAFYAWHGFVECEPFEPYVVDPNSVFMSLDLRDVP